MLAQVALPLAIPINSPYPAMLALGAIGMVVFGAELALARRGGQAHARLSALLTGCLVVAAALVVAGAAYAVSSPAAAEPVLRLSGARNPVYELYLGLWDASLLIALLIAMFALVAGAMLLRGRRRHPVSAPAA